MEGPLRNGPLTAADLRDPGLRLVETLLWDGAAFPRLAGHMARLTASALAFGWPCDPAAVGAALAAAVPARQARRVRLMLAASGAVAVQAVPLPASPPVWRLAPAATRLDPADPWLSVKSTRRAAYDTARAALPEGIDEAVFLNTRGEVCDGSITTLFFDAGEGLRTPPRACGLLPGVLRADLLAQGACREAVLAGGDLPHVRLWVGNALRGLMPAVWAGRGAP